MSTPSAAGGRIGPAGVTMERLTVLAFASLAILVVALVIASRISAPLFVVCGLAILAALAFLSYLHPRGMLIAVIFAPIIDRYFVSLLIPESLHGVTNYL